MSTARLGVSRSRQKARLISNLGRRLIEEFSALESGVAASAGEPRGLLRVNTGLAFGLDHLTPVLAAFQSQYPEVQINLSLTDRVVDLHDELVDVAIRSVGVARDSSLMARKLADTYRVVCASSTYLKSFGKPETPADLARHRCIVFSSSADGERWPFRTPAGTIEYVDVGGPLTTDNSECALQLALSGAGIIRIGEVLVSDAVKQGTLLPLLQDCHEPERRTTWAVFHAGTQNVPQCFSIFWSNVLAERRGGSHNLTTLIASARDRDQPAADAHLVACDRREFEAGSCARSA